MIAKTIFLFVTFLVFTQQCVHDEFAHKTQKHFYNDHDDLQGRILQQTSTQQGRLRIFADYNQLKVGGHTQINTIKRIVNITASFFYQTLSVNRLDRLYFPANTSLKCNVLAIPETYVTNGIIGDLGVVIGNQQNSKVVYVAKSTSCAYLKSSNRPIWGMIMFNNVFLKFDQVGFQQNLFVGIHEMTHVVGFSANLYSMYPNGNPLVQQPNGDYYLFSERLRVQAAAHFGCNQTKGILLEDQDATIISSHWQRKLVGSQYMIATSKISAYISRFTLALLQSSGWYTKVNYTFAEKTTWGKNKGCPMFDINSCDSSQFCSGSNYDCDSTGDMIGQCRADAFAGACKTIKYFTNTICVDENYQLKNLNAKLLAEERGGSNSKCFVSNFRQTGLTANQLNNRCYVTVCSITGKLLFILIGQSILICRTPGQVLSGPVGMDGTLTCPSSFENYCNQKQNCPYHCNMNGACLNGQCLCAGNKQLTPTCLDISIYDAPIGSTGGFLMSLHDHNSNLDLQNNGIQEEENSNNYKATITVYSMNHKCLAGTVFDSNFGECLKCKEVFNCASCDQNGCFVCDNGQNPFGGKCLSR